MVDREQGRIPAIRGKGGSESGSQLVHGIAVTRGRQVAVLPHIGSGVEVAGHHDGPVRGRRSHRGEPVLDVLDAAAPIVDGVVSVRERGLHMNADEDGVAADTGDREEGGRRGRGRVWRTWQRRQRETTPHADPAGKRGRDQMRVGKRPFDAGAGESVHGARRQLHHNDDVGILLGIGAALIFGLALSVASTVVLLRALQDRSALDELLGAVMAARGSRTTPIFLKVAPDLEPADVEDIAAACVDHRVDALIVSNTTISRPPLRSPLAGEAGGLSGAPLHDLALARLRDFRRVTGGRLPLIGVGGIATAEQAYARIRAGASLIQLYSALVYEGPYLARRINQGLKALMARDGVARIADLVGVDA